MKSQLSFKLLAAMVLLVILLSGCAQAGTPVNASEIDDSVSGEVKEDPAKAGEQEAGGTQEEEKDAGNQAQASDKETAKVVRVLAVSGPETDSLIESANEFEEATGITASIEQVSRTLWSERKVRELLQDSGIYDIVMIGGGDDLVWLKEKAHVLPLDDYLSEEDKTQLMHADMFTVDGALIGVPQYYNFPMLFYRKDMLEDPAEQEAFQAEYGRELTVPVNYDELQEVAAFFNRPDEDMTGFCLGGVDWSVFLDYTYYLYGTGGNFGDLESAELTLNSPEAVRAMDALTRMTQYNPKGWETMSFFDCDTQMLAGKTFMYQNWFYIWTTFQQEMPDIAMAPVTGDANPGAHIGAMVAVIPEAAPSPDAGGAFISWMLSSSYQGQMTAATGNMPVRQDVLEDPEIRDILVGIEMYEQTVPYLSYQHTTWPSELDSGVTEAIWKVLKGDMDAQQACDWLQNEKFEGRMAIE